MKKLITIIILGLLSFNLFAADQLPKGNIAQDESSEKPKSDAESACHDSEVVSTGRTFQEFPAQEDYGEPIIPADNVMQADGNSN